MNNQLYDFMTDLRAAESVDQAGQSFIAFAQKTGASAVHTFFGTAPDKQSISTLPAPYTQEEGRIALMGAFTTANQVRSGTPRVIWGIDYVASNPNATAADVEQAAGRFQNFRQRSSVTFSMPNNDNSFSGAGVGVGFEDTGAQFLKRMEESGGALAVASFAAYSQMLKLEEPANDQSPLSPRQAELLTLLASGQRLSDIADTMKIADSTVNLYLHNLRAKLGVRTKEQALAIAISKGWITP